MIWFHLKRFPGTKRHKLTIWGNLKRFPGTKRRIWVYYNSSWYRLRSSGCGCLHGCCLRSAPARSGASQFAPRASAAVSHETRYHTKCHIQPETQEVVHASCRRQLLHSVNGKEFFHMVAGDGRRPLAQVLRNSLPGHPPLSATKRDTIQNAISSQRREGPSRYRVIVTQYEVTIICQITWRMILLY